MIMNRNERTELLARADTDKIRRLAEEFLGQRKINEDLHIINPPEVGMVMMQVREPVCKERFHLGEVVVTRAEVALGSSRGWAMRAGTDRETTLAAALLDACAEYATELAEAVDELCRQTAERLAQDEQREWTELRATTVNFEELD
jgi:alpha-D-ribose 1-methylphosphonate 5-triphosphate synthase subunit PhnG